MLICTPEHAGTLPGGLKNLLDWTVGGGQLYGRPVASLHVAAPGRGDGAQATRTTVLSYLGAALTDPARIRVHVPRDAVGADGLIQRQELRDALRQALTTLADQLRARPPH